MTEYKDLFVRLVKNETGATLLEYVALGVLLIIAIWAIVKQLSGTVGNRFENIDQKFKEFN